MSSLFTFFQKHEQSLIFFSNKKVLFSQVGVWETNIQKGEVMIEVRPQPTKTESILRHAKGPTHSTPTFCYNFQLIIQFSFFHVLLSFNSIKSKNNRIYFNTYKLQVVLLNCFLPQNCSIWCLVHNVLHLHDLHPFGTSPAGVCCQWPSACPHSTGNHSMHAYTLVFTKQ